MLSHQAHTMWSLTDTDEGYHLGAPNILLSTIQPSHLMILPFPLVAPPGLKLNQLFHSSSTKVISKPTG
jgi:hypothetical protein